MEKVKIKDGFWSKYRELVRSEMIPYQWNVLNDRAGITIEKERTDGGSPSEKSHAIENLKIAAGRTKGEHYGWIFQDSDVYKWLEAVAYSLQEHPDPELQKIADETVDLIAEAQDEDGYLHTYIQLRCPDLKFKRLGEAHELYCAGHFFEAATAYHAVTGNEKVLKVAKKWADCLVRNFGPGKIEGTDGHEEVEIGLLKLYRSTGEKRYLDLAKYFMDIRGSVMPFFKKQLEEDPHRESAWGIGNGDGRYLQADVDVTKQTVARGHAVRQVYLTTAMADLAAETGDQEYLDACKRLWEDVTKRQMYITGGIGSTANGEAFTSDYDLPLGTMYCETCASVGMVFWARQMLLCESRSEYADVMERELYNGTISGMALDGKHFFYVNPLSVDPRKIKNDPLKTHVKPVRPSWLGCACCPPNLARMLTSLDQYIYTLKDDTILVNLFIGSEAEFEVSGSRAVIAQETEYPHDGTIRIKVTGTDGMKVGIRIPGFLTDDGVVSSATKAAYTLTRGGQKVETDPEKGYVYLQGPFTGEEIVFRFELKPELYAANPFVESMAGKAALMRGPVVYCLEEADNGKDLETLAVSADTEFTYAREQGTLGNIGVITAKGMRKEPEDNTALYRKIRSRAYSKTEVDLKWIPYYAWANRGEGEMTVFINYDDFQLE